MLNEYLRSNCACPCFPKVHAIYAEQRPADLFTNFEVSRDPEEWAHVERLLATPFIPPPPPHLRYPTPSGWSPPNPDPSLDWTVRRKKDHHYDIKVEDQWKLKTLDPVGGGGFQVGFLGSGVDFLTSNLSLAILRLQLIEVSYLIKSYALASLAIIFMISFICNMRSQQPIFYSPLVC